MNLCERFEFATAYGAAKLANKCLAIFDRNAYFEHPMHQFDEKEYMAEGNFSF